jgi:ionotropic glutamate receptor NMDA 1
MLLAASIYAAALIFLFERRDNETLRNRSKVSSAAMRGWYSVDTLMGYGVDYNAKTAAGRLLTVDLYILSLVLLATYTANFLTANLTILKSQDIISDIDDIKNGKIPFNRIGIIVDTVSEYFYLREVSGGSRNFYPLRSQQELFDALLSGVIDASLMDSSAAEYVTSSVYCNLTLVGAGFDKGAFSIVMSKRWIYAEDLDINILSLKESGALDDLKRKWFQKPSWPDSAALSTSMGIVTMGGLFLTFAIISVLSLVLFAWNTRFMIKNYILTRVRR